MKPQLLKIPRNPDHCFSSRHDIVPVFYNKWHYHEEMELVYVIKGSGSLFIGHEIKHFKAGYLVLLGSNLPHMWGNDKKKQQKKNESYVVHFLPACLGAPFFSLPENKGILSVYQKAQKGLQVKGKVRESIVVYMQRLLTAQGTERIILLLQILNAIAGAKENKTICKEIFNLHVTPQDSDRLNDIYQYVMNNFSRPLRLEKISRIAHLAPTSFCRYFKSRTRKSFSSFLIEIRISYACKLLVETKKTVSEIVYECGYNSFSNFNKHFLLLTGKTPLAHRKYYLENEE